MHRGVVTLFLLFPAGLLAGFIDSIAGGGGIITVPALLAVGIPPHQALATNKLQSSCGSLTASVNYARLGLMNPGELVAGFIFSFLGAVGGAVTVQFFSADFLENLIIVMLIILFVYTLFSPQLGYVRKPHKINHLSFYVIFGLLIGFYDGFFGPGTGSFWTISLVVLLGLDLKQATAQTKLFNLTSNVVALGVFLSSGLVLWSAGLAMGAGQVIGAYCGSTLVSKKEVHFIRVFFLCVVAATIIKLLVDRSC
ncbi:MAG TPA: hypothetical protein ENK89_07200 [Desulfobulbaceae bacterium]|nr:hypothetical protein [Desulfobulbaceae bacterium]